MLARKPLLMRRRSGVAPAPAELGDILDAGQVRDRFFQNRVSREFVLEKVAPEKKFYLGRIAAWYEGDVKAWMPLYVQAQQERAAQRRRSRRGG